MTAVQPRPRLNWLPRDPPIRLHPNLISCQGSIKRPRLGRRLKRRPPGMKKGRPRLVMAACGQPDLTSPSNQLPLQIRMTPSIIHHLYMTAKPETKSTETRRDVRRTHS